MFRDEAVQHYQAAQRAEGEPLRASPVWLTLSSYALLAVVVALVVFASWVPLPRFVSAQGTLHSTTEGTELWAAVPLAEMPRLVEGATAALSQGEAVFLKVESAPWSAVALSERLGTPMGTFDAQTPYALIRARVSGPLDAATLHGLVLRARFHVGDEPLSHRLLPWVFDRHPR
ncbi:MAG: hypothetical protein ACT4TC_08075 [Myxococcaceae bacterium]